MAFLACSYKCNYISTKNYIIVTEEKYHRIGTQQATNNQCKRNMFLSPNPDYSHFSKDLIIRSSETVKILEIIAFLKINSGHKF